MKPQRTFFKSNGRLHDKIGGSFNYFNEQKHETHLRSDTQICVNAQRSNFIVRLYFFREFLCIFVCDLSSVIK